MTVQVGDIVLYGKYAGQELQYQGEDYLIMREDDILSLLKDAPISFFPIYF
jgi:chaperonin GroES